MIIGISGKIGSGKDEVGRLILQYAQQKWEVKKFATKLKQIVGLLTGRTIEELEQTYVKNAHLPPEWSAFRMGCFVTTDRSEMEGIIGSIDKTATKLGFGSPRGSEEAIDYWVSPTYRQLMQWIGTEAMRDVIHPDVWVNALFADYDPHTVDPTLEEPIQYPNWLITDLRFPNEMQRIKKFGGKCIRVERPGIQTTDHISETALDNVSQWDELICNDGTLDDLARKVSRIVKYLEL